MLPVLLMIALQLWLVGVGIAAYVLLRTYFDLSGQDPPHDDTSRQTDSQGTPLPDSKRHIA